MHTYQINGRASYNYSVDNNFSEIVQSDASDFAYMDGKMKSALLAKHPDWKSIVINSCKRLD